MRNPEEVVKWGRNEIVRASGVFGLPPEDLVLTGGSLARFHHALAHADLDFVSKSGATPTREAEATTSRAYTFVDLGREGVVQLLRRWDGEPPYDFDWVHLSAFVSMDDYYFPACFATRTLEVGPSLLDHPAPLIRVVKWLQLGFTIDNDHLKQLLQALFPDVDFEPLRFWGGS